jgi:hypothetical protein
MRVTGEKRVSWRSGARGGGGGRTVKDCAAALAVAAEPESGRARCEVGPGAIGVFRREWWKVFVGVGALEGGLDGGRVELEERGERLLGGLFVEGVAVHGEVRRGEDDLPVGGVVFGCLCLGAV